MNEGPLDDWDFVRLKEHHDSIVGVGGQAARTLDDAKRDGHVRVSTIGNLLLLPQDRTQIKMEIPVADVTRDKEALNRATRARLYCRYPHASKNKIRIFFFLDGGNTKLEDGMSLQPGEEVWARLGRYVDGSSEPEMDELGSGTREGSASTSVDIMPVADTLRDDNIYYDRKFDQISYILSEFIDNALQHAVQEYRFRNKEAEKLGAAAVEEAKRRRPWIRLTILVKDDHVAFCVEDNGTGIKHESLGRALRKKACACHDADKGLKKFKLEHENDHPGFVDALISEYGVGLKQAGFFLSNIIKVVCKLSSSDAAAEPVYDCTVDFEELKNSWAVKGERWEVPKQSRQAGEEHTSATERLKGFEGEFEWFQERLRRELVSTSEPGGLGWSDSAETGTAIMFHDIRTTLPDGATPLRVGGKLVKSLLQDVPQIMSDLQNIYYWYACGRLNARLFKESPLEEDASTVPLVKIEVELVSPTKPRLAVPLMSLETFRDEKHPIPVERALDDVIREYSRSRLPPLSKVFYLVFREEVDNPKEPGGKSLVIKWSAAVMLCYCPFKQGEETRAGVDMCFPDGRELQGFGDGCAYWHGKLVPGTRVGKVPWLELPDVIEAVLEDRAAGREQELGGRGARIAPRRDESAKKERQQDKSKLLSSTHRVVTRWFFNSRTLITDDKFELMSAVQDSLKLVLEDSRSGAERSLQATDANAVRALLTNTDLRKALTNTPGDSSRLIISDRQFETETVDGAAVLSGRQPAETLNFNGSERTLADGINKMYDFVLQASKHDDIAEIEVAPSGGGKIINSVKFLGSEFKVGLDAHFVGCEGLGVLPGERELFVGRIEGFRLRADPAKETDPDLRAFGRADLEEYKLRPLSGFSRLPDKEIVEVHVRWPDALGGSKQEESSWVPLDHVLRPDLDSESFVVSPDERFVDNDGPDDDFRRDIQKLSNLHWLSKPIAANLADSPSKRLPRQITAVRAANDAAGDILYPAITNVHQALRHYLEMTGQRADKNRHVYVLRVPPLELSGASVAVNTDTVNTVKVSPLPTAAQWPGVWINGAFTFREIPICSLIVRAPSAVAATLRHLESCQPLKQLYVRYVPDMGAPYVELEPGSAEVRAGARMGSCYVQIHDQQGHPITEMPFLSRGTKGSVPYLVMMRSLKLRRVQHVRAPCTGEGSEEGEWGSDEEEDPWHNILGDSKKKKKKKGEKGVVRPEEEDEDGTVPQHDGFKSNNTWEFAKKGNTASASPPQLSSEQAQRTFRVPKDFSQTNGKQDGNDKILYPFSNACLEYKVEMVAVLSNSKKNGISHTEDAPDTSDSWQPQSRWSSVVRVMPGSPESPPRLLSQPLSSQQYFLGDPLPSLPLKIFMTDGFRDGIQAVNRKQGNLVPWPEPPRNLAIEGREANGPVVLRLHSKPGQHVSPSLSPHDQLLDLLPQQQTVSVPSALLEMSKLRLGPVSVTDCSFTSDESRICELTLSFTLRGGDQLSVPLGSLAVLPGPPYKLQQVGAVRAVPVVGQPGLYELSPISVDVRDEFDLPTHKSRATPNPSMTVAVTAPGGARLERSARQSFANADCRATFDQLRVHVADRVPRAGIQATLKFEVKLQRGSVTRDVKVHLPPPREPHHFELLRGGEPVQPSAAAPASSRSSREKQTFIIEEAQGASVNNLTLRVLSVYDDHLDGTEITLSLSTAGLATVRSGDTLPPLAAGSFGTELVVRDYDESQKQCGEQINAKAGESCVCMISLRPKIVVDGLRWDLGPRGSAELPAGMSVPLTVGEAWDTSLELRVVDANGSTFALPRGLPSSLRLSASRTFAFAAPGAIDPPRVETRGSRGKAPNRVVGKVGSYDLTVRSGDAAAGAPLESTPIKVELKHGEVEGIVVESELELSAIQDRCKLPPNAIAVLLQDEGGNPIPPQRACRYVLNVTSDDLIGGATMSWDDGQGCFVFESELVVVRNRSRALSLKFAVCEAHQTRRGGAETLPSLKKRIGTGWERPPFIERIERIDGNETGLVLSPGSPLPLTSFKLVTADGSALEDSGIVESQVEVALSFAAAPPDLEYPQLAHSVSDAGLVTVQANDGQQIFRTTGVYELTIKYTEHRQAWDMLPPDEKVVSHAMRIEVKYDGSDAPEAHYVLHPEVPGQLFQTPDRAQSLPNQLYSLRDLGQHEAFVSELQRVDAFGNVLPGDASVELFLKQSGQYLSSRTFQLEQGRLAIRSDFVFKNLRQDRQGRAVELESDKTYSVTVDEGGESELLTFTFTTNARRDELLRQLQTAKGRLEEQRHREEAQRSDIARIHLELRQANAERFPQTRAAASAECERLRASLVTAEQQLDALRPTYPGAKRPLMTELVEGGGMVGDFVGIVGELAVVDDPRKAVCLSFLLGRKAGFLVAVTPESRDRLRGSRATFDLASLPSARLHRELPHKQQNNLKPGARPVLGDGRAFEAELSSPLSAIEFLPSDLAKRDDLVRLFSKFFGGYLFCATEQLARAYSQLVWSHPSLICLDTGLIYSQGDAAGDSQALIVRADAPNYFPNEELSQALQDKQRLQRIYRTSQELLDFFNSQTQHEAVDLDAQQQMLRQLLTLGYPSKQPQLDELQQFFSEHIERSRSAGSKRPNPESGRAGSSAPQRQTRPRGP